MQARHTEELTEGERLLLHRRRLGLTQPDMADRLNLSMAEYTARELDRGKWRRKIRTFRGMLLDHERCLILRRRLGMSRLDVAVELDLSENWITLMERGRKPCGRMLTFLESA